MHKNTYAIAQTALCVADGAIVAYGVIVVYGVILLYGVIVVYNMIVVCGLIVAYGLILVDGVIVVYGVIVYGVIAYGVIVQGRKTPLHYSAENGKDKTAQHLLDAKADVDARDEVRASARGPGRGRGWVC